jgi:hypothetical protein
MQLVLKIDMSALGGRETWRALGSLLVREIVALRSGVRLVDRQIIVALPKLAPDDILAMLDSLTRREPCVARTILNAALDASVPREAAERYLAGGGRPEARHPTLDSVTRSDRLRGVLPSRSITSGGAVIVCMRGCLCGDVVPSR